MPQACTLLTEAAITARIEFLTLSHSQSSRLQVLRQHPGGSKILLGGVQGAGKKALAYCLVNNLRAKVLLQVDAKALMALDSIE